MWISVCGFTLNLLAHSGLLYLSAFSSAGWPSEQSGGVSEVCGLPPCHCLEGSRCLLSPMHKDRCCVFFLWLIKNEHSPTINLNTQRNTGCKRGDYLDWTKTAYYIKIREIKTLRISFILNYPNTVSHIFVLIIYSHTSSYMVYVLLGSHNFIQADSYIWCQYRLKKDGSGVLLQRPDEVRAMVGWGRN